MLAKSEGYQCVLNGEITDLEREALVKVRDMLRSGELKEEPDEWDWQEGHYFAMNNWLEPGDYENCGTVGCIAGSCYRLFEGKPFRWWVEDGSTTFGLVSSKGRLRSLFVPDMRRCCTPARAADAITAYLSGAADPWE